MNCFLCDLNCNPDLARGVFILREIGPNSIKYSEIIENLIGNSFIITINEEDVICQTCLVLIEELYRFYNKTKTIEKILLRQVLRKYNIEQSDQESLNDVDRQAERSFNRDSNKEYICRQCLFKTHYIDAIASHYKYHTIVKDKQNIYWQQEPEQNISISNILNRELKTQHREELPESLLVDKLNDSDKYAKTEQDQFLEKENLSINVNDNNIIVQDEVTVNSDAISKVDSLSFEQHVQNTDDSLDDTNLAISSIEEDTIIDGKQVSNLASLHSEENYLQVEKIEIDVLQQERNNIFCEFCGETITDTIPCQHGNAIATEQPKLDCKKCYLTFYSESLMKCHYNSKHTSNKYHCEICSKTLHTAYSFARHMKSHIGNFNYICEFCNKGFLEKQHYKEHRSTHTQEKLYLCEECGQSFISQYSFDLHKLKHTKKPFFCPVCFKLFAAKYLLNNHIIRTHRKEKPHSCTYDGCNREFSSKSYWVKHVQLHAGIYPFHCSLCNQNFLRKFIYGKHMAMYHDDFSIVNCPPKSESKMQVLHPQSEDSSK